MQARLAIPLAAALAVAAPGAAPAGDSADYLPVRHELGEALNVLLDSYSAVAAGWYLETRCQHLPPAMDQVYLGYRDRIAAFIDDLVIPEVMEDVEQAAREAGNAAPRCGSRTNRLVTNNFRLAEDLAGLISGPSD